MTSPYQACIGPSMSIMHLRDRATTKPMNGDLTVCKLTSIVKDYSGMLRVNLLCSKCRENVVEKFTEYLDDNPHLGDGNYASSFADYIGIQCLIVT